MPRKGKSATATGVIVPASIPDLVKAANFGYINPAFLPENSSRWIGPGDRVRGDFRLIRMNGKYSAQDAQALVDRTPELHLATVYEVLHYAGQAEGGWNGQDFVLALGSSYTPEKTCHTGALLWSGDIKRGLSLRIVDSQNPCWFDFHILLCVEF